MALLQGNQVRLAALDEHDLPNIARWHSDAEFLRLQEARPAMPQTQTALSQWLEEQQRATDAFVFGIRAQDDDALVGLVTIDGILWNQGTGWLTLAIGEPARRDQGMGSEALRLALAFAFGELNLHRLQLTVFSYNARAIHVYERAGFLREGSFREMLHRDGKRFDMYLYGLLRHEWANRMAQHQ